MVRYVLFMEALIPGGGSNTNTCAKRSNVVGTLGFISQERKSLN